MRSGHFWLSSNSTGKKETTFTKTRMEIKNKTQPTICDSVFQDNLWYNRSTDHDWGF